MRGLARSDRNKDNTAYTQLTSSPPLIAGFVREIIISDDDNEIDEGHKDMTKRVGMVARVSYELGDEVFVSYNGEGRRYGSSTIYYLFGFVTASANDDTCQDMIHLRHSGHDIEEKVKCLEVRLNEERRLERSDS